jgi:hypothetical protein
MKVLLPSFDIAGVPAHRPTVFPGRADRRASNVIRVAILALITGIPFQSAVQFIRLMGCLLQLCAAE